MDDTMSSHSGISAVDTSRPLPMTFGKWRDACMSKPSKKDKVGSQATEVFAFLSRHTELVTPENKVVKTRSSHNEALSQLIQELAPAFSDTARHASRICALFCICGAIKGCSNAGLSYKITELLGSFFLGQCGPIDPQDDDEEEDTDELVRDAALKCLCALVRAKLQCKDETSVQQFVELHLNLAKQGVERRCAAPDLDQQIEYDHGYDFPSSNDIGGGLSTLPRSRRSVCFDLVRATIDGLALVTVESLGDDSTLTSALASFASFAASCLHGESDPRCLLQLLGMLHALQCNMLSFFQAASLSAMFPTMHIFDAVAPYYPIQFTPPPNDVYGITRKGLNDSLMAVLCCTAFDALTNESMLNLSAGLFLEHLLDDGTSSVEDKLEAITDLSTLLFQDSSFCDRLSRGTVKELSDALLATHTEATAGASSRGDTGRMYKKLADSCRDFVTQVAVALEESSQSMLWDVFVVDVVRTRAVDLTSPQSSQGRASVAYMACLAASGGPRTLSLCLESCLPPLVDIFTREKDDEEKVVAAAYGVGAFFSSFQMAFSRRRCEGVALHPHPLQPFSTKVLRALCAFIGVHGNNRKEEGNDKQVPPLVRTAAVRTLDSVLAATPLSLVEKSDLDDLCDLFETLEALIATEGCVDTDMFDGNTAEIELKKAASRTIGSIIGKSLQDSSAQTAELRSVLDESEKVRVYLREDIFFKLLASSDRGSASKSLRFDWMALAFCCQMNQEAAVQVVSATTNALNEALKHKVNYASYQQMEVHCAKRLSFVIQRGGVNAASSFRTLSAPNASPMDVVVSLSGMPESSEKKAKSRGAPEKAGVSRVSALILPPTAEDREEVKVTVDRAFEVVPYLLPAYEYPMPQTQMEQLLDYMSRLLPPLNYWQYGQLCIALPFLSVILSHGTTKIVEEDKRNSVFDSFKSITPYLTECALAAEYDPRARSAAASSLYYIVTKFQRDSSLECLSKIALRDTVMPWILESTGSEYLMSTEKAETAMSSLSESFSVAALLGSAAARRGKSSSKTADEVALFLIHLACNGKAKVPFIPDHLILDLTVLEEFRLRIAAASAFGTMVSTEDGTPFWRQRIVHLATNHLIPLLANETSHSSLLPSDLTAAELGRLMISFHVIANSSATAIGETNLKALGVTVMVDLAKLYANDEKLKSVGTLLGSVRELTLVAVVKLMVTCPEMVEERLSTLIPLLLLAYTDEGLNGTTSVIPCKMLALQGLVICTRYFRDSKQGLLAIKPAVLSVLSSASDHPSSAVRQAAVDARNAWFTMG